MVAQSRSGIEGKSEFSKHMIRMRHAAHVGARPEANEIILINSHDGASSYQMLAGVFRLWPASHRRNYVSRPTMSRQAGSAICQAHSIQDIDRRHRKANQSWEGL